MKKQILILIVAFFAMSFSNVFGQATNGTTPRPTVCGSGDALHPIAGHSYNYSATVNPTGGIFQWWAQTGNTFICSSPNVVVRVCNNSVDHIIWQAVFFIIFCKLTGFFIKFIQTDIAAKPKVFI